MFHSINFNCICTNLTMIHDYINRFSKNEKYYLLSKRSSFYLASEFSCVVWSDVLDDQVDWVADDRFLSPLLHVKLLSENSQRKVFFWGEIFNRIEMMITDRTKGWKLNCFMKFPWQSTGKFFFSEISKTYDRNCCQFSNRFY